MMSTQPVQRKHIHTREIRCVGFEREDGLWDIEGRIVDKKTYSFENHDRGVIEAGTPVHNMFIRLTVDDKLVVREAKALTEAAPFSICSEISDSVSQLKGLRISSGWRRSVKEKIGGIKGCTHITQLLIGPLATTAYQTIIPLKNRHKKNKIPTQKPKIIDTCHGWSAKGPIVKRIWPKYSES